MNYSGHDGVVDTEVILHVWTRISGEIQNMKIERDILSGRPGHLERELRVRVAWIHIVIQAWVCVHAISVVTSVMPQARGVHDFDHSIEIVIVQTSGVGRNRDD